MKHFEHHTCDGTDGDIDFTKMAPNEHVKEAHLSVRTWDDRGGTTLISVTKFDAKIIGEAFLSYSQETEK